MKQLPQLRLAKLLGLIPPGWSYEWDMCRWTKGPARDRIFIRREDMVDPYSQWTVFHDELGYVCNRKGGIEFFATDFDAIDRAENCFIHINKNTP